MAQETQTGALYQPSRVGWGERWEGGSKGGDICIPMADSGWRFDRKQQKSVKQLSFNKNYYFFLKQRHYFANKGPYSQSYGFSISHVWL